MTDRAEREKRERDRRWRRSWRTADALTVLLDGYA